MMSLGKLFVSLVISFYPLFLPPVPPLEISDLLKCTYKPCSRFLCMSCINSTLFPAFILLHFYKTAITACGIFERDDETTVCVDKTCHLVVLTDEKHGNDGDKRRR